MNLRLVVQNEKNIFSQNTMKYHFGDIFCKMFQTIKSS